MDVSTIIFLGSAFLASGISTIVGFGSALILISVSSLIFGVKWSIAMTTFLYAFNTGTKTILFRKHIDWHTTFLVTITALPGVFVGAYFLLKSDAGIINWCLAVIVLIYLVVDLIKRKNAFKLNKLVLLAAGAVYGFLSGSVGTGSIIKVMVFKHLNLEKRQFVATMATTALPLNICKIVVFTTGALINQTDIPLILGLLIASLLGTFLGKHILNKLPELIFYYLVRIVLFTIAIRILLF
jgi:uncharacterized protein